MMKRMLALLLILFALPASATVRVLATVPEWGSLVQEIGGERVSVTVVATAMQDPHRIEARPSLIARGRNADMVVATGADLEAGWLPLLLRESGNRRIQPGETGYFEAASAVKLLNVPEHIDRSMGDIHPAGSPHFHLDPRNILLIAFALAERLERTDPDGATVYRENLKNFTGRWQAAMVRWQQAGAPLRGVSYLQVHRSFCYFANWLGMESRGELEPKPGIEPTSAHLGNIVSARQKEPAAVIFRAAYQHDAAARWVSERTGIPVVTLAYTVGGTPEAKDLFGLFDDTLMRIRKAVDRQ